MIATWIVVAGRNALLCLVSWGLLGGGKAAAQASSATSHQPMLPNEPEVRSPVVLKAINDSRTGKGAFLFHGNEEPPVLRARPGEDVDVTYVNAMSAHSQEICIYVRCTNMSNLHFHGLHVSPNAPQDDAITMMAMPGQTLHYIVNVPLDQAPGLYWYHTHPHGESYQQDLDGMSGAIVIEGLERYVPEVQGMRERILVLRDQIVEGSGPIAAELKRRVEIPSSRCGAAAGQPGRIFTVNGVVRPRVDIAPGERQLWRIVNASPDLYADLKIDTERMEVVALDGMPLSFHDPTHRVEFRDHVLVPPAGRVEAIVTGPRQGVHASLRTRCFDTGPDGDPNPDMVLADLVDTGRPARKAPAVSVARGAAVFKPVPPTLIAKVEKSPADFVVTFTEDKNGFYINGKKYGPLDAPMTTVAIGAFHHWRVVNNTHEAHPFHIHQVHFLSYAENGSRDQRAEWLDTVDVPVEGNVDLMMDFTDPIIRGVSLFHCHLLKHEDKGMMAKILFK